MQSADRRHHLPRTSPLRRALGLVTPLVLLLSATLSAQQHGAAVQLLVVDAATTRPIEGVRVVVDGGARGGLTDAAGIVEIASSAGDSLVFELRMLGYAPLELTVYAVAGMPLLVTVPLEPAPVRLTPVRVAVESAPRSRSLREFYERVRRGPGQYLTRSDIERRDVRTLTDLFRTVPGISMSSTIFGETPMMEAKGSMLPDRGSSDCAVQYFLDGTPITPPEGAIGFDVDLNDVEGIEIYRRGTLVPSRFQRQRGSCGVILIWKRESLRE